MIFSVTLIDGQNSAGDHAFSSGDFHQQPVLCNIPGLHTVRLDRNWPSIQCISGFMENLNESNNF